MKHINLNSNSNYDFDFSILEIIQNQIVIIKAATNSLKAHHLFHGIYLEDALHTREYLEETIQHPFVERDRIQCNIDLLRIAIDSIMKQMQQQKLCFYKKYMLHIALYFLNSMNA